MSISDDEVEAASISLVSELVKEGLTDVSWSSARNMASVALSAAAKVRAIREGDGEVKSFAGSIPAHAKWCQPGDRQDKRLFIVRFDDPDCRDSVFTDEAEARAFYAKATLNWNCYLFGALPAHPAAASPVPATGGEKE